MSQVKFYDTHAHFTQSVEETAQVMLRAQAQDVVRIVAVGGSVELNAGALAVVTAFPTQTRLALGFDCTQADTADVQTNLETVRRMAQGHTLAAVGETGLDFHYQPENADQQAALLSAHLLLADAWGLPVIIHTRDADAATLQVLDETPWRGKGLRGVVHCFTGECTFARQLLDRQLAISFSGIVTFRNAAQVRESAAYVPGDRLLIETDAPFLAPVPMRGKLNEPAFVRHVVTCLAEVRKTDPERLAAITWQNACTLFG